MQVLQHQGDVVPWGISWVALFSFFLFFFYFLSFIIFFLPGFSYNCEHSALSTNCGPCSSTEALREAAAPR